MSGTNKDRARAEDLANVRRGQILDAATAIFAEKGFSRATIRDVARQAGLADGTIYIYFPSKTALLIGILDRMNESDAREQDLAADFMGDLQSFFAAYLNHRLSVIAPAYEMLRAVLPEVLVNADLRELYFQRVIAPTLAVGERFLQAQIQQGRMRALDAPLATRAMASLALGLLVLQMLGDDYLAKHSSDLGIQLAALLFEGIRPRGGEREDLAE
jgi:AcrR family transcriptional regulator